MLFEQVRMGNLPTSELCSNMNTSYLLTASCYILLCKTSRPDGMHEIICSYSLLTKNIQGGKMLYTQFS